MTALDILKFPVKSAISVSREVDVPPWVIGLPPVNFSLTGYLKGATSPPVYRREFDELLHECGGWARVFTDGSKTQDGVGDNRRPSRIRIPPSAVVDIYGGAMLNPVSS